jgi:DNA-binding GntR family transcriptional regulator
VARAAEKAYCAVRERILRGIYPPALRITEQEIADSTGVSRTPVREALRRLQAEGFVTVIANQGALVTEWSPHDTDDVFELRALLEPYGAARAAKRITDQGIAELRALATAQYQESERREEGYVERIGDLNSRFHRQLQAFSGNARLTTLLPVLIEAPLVFRTFATYQPDELLRSAAHHLEIISALEARDPEWAAAVMRSHILAAQNSSRRSQQQRDAAPDSGATPAR